MKKVMLALLCITLALLALTGCNRPQKSNILKFEVADIKNIEVYNFIIPMEAKSMVVTESQDIKQIVTAFSEIKIEREATNEDETSGGEVLSFRFNLKDGKEFVIAHWDGILRSPEDINYNVSGNALEALWGNLNYDKQTVTEDSLPIINK